MNSTSTPRKSAGTLTGAWVDKRRVGLWVEILLNGMNNSFTHKVIEQLQAADKRLNHLEEVALSTDPPYAFELANSPTLGHLTKIVGEKLYAYMIYYKEGADRGPVDLVGMKAALKKAGIPTILDVGLY